MTDVGEFRKPEKPRYDVVIIGGAVIGSASAWFLSANPDFNGSVLVVERDPGYTCCSTALSLSGVRHQFSCAVNVRISMFASEFIRNFSQYLEDESAPDLKLVEHGYLFMATEAGTRTKFSRSFRSTIPLMSTWAAGTPWGKAGSTVSA
jgi:glycine/D-amino acid oxidase-like deaminating enzyme